MDTFLLALTRLQDWRNIIDIALVSMIFYVVLLLFRGTQAVQLARGILVIFVITLIVSQTVQLTAFNWLLSKSTSLVLVAIPVIFQPEIRRALERVGRTAPLLVRRGDNAGTQRVINEVIKAVEQMSDHRHGALIVFEGGTGLGEFIDRGVAIDAEVSSELLTTIFYPNTALHDGAVIISGMRIAAASCVLPLTQRELSDSQMGTRHRAAIGVTEQADALTVVVSEETGNISVARNGRILRLDSSRLRTLLSDFYRP
ncbi:diadenylate cyclase CdaA [Litorilinea aerophila]|uniref:Diadenylate cyclase n=1 Tax=Litorilinea aerophila TaxID=1204385 RepID=A0A540VBD0_9CHLR|nr:diadenylate cyclase CdaA [Litorilinea aerophila]MCC9078082.1 diadenylate cyclase CdaA [Litorilinea aerophila]OUC07531.1 membrane protein [Litorilinea aerophila]GIV77938.1 MAG: membrane protein [Litorilinea sp.]